MKGVVLVYVGLITLLVGAVSLIKPLGFLGVKSLEIAAVVIPVGSLLMVAGALLPAPLQRVVSPESRLDEWMPEWQFGEYHSIRIYATPEKVYRAIREVTAEDIFLFRTLTWIRNPRLRSRQPEHILNPPRRKPILEVAQAGGFLMLADEPPHEIVLMTVVISNAAVWHDVLETHEERMQQLTSRPGNAVATVNFRVHDTGEGSCHVSTETRVFATDSSSRRRFAAYWRVIYPGSSVIRYTWLRAIKHRSEKSPS